MCRKPRALEDRSSRVGNMPSNVCKSRRARPKGVPRNPAPYKSHASQDVQRCNDVRRPFLVDSGTIGAFAFDPIETVTQARINNEVAFFTSEAWLHKRGKSIFPILNFRCQVFGLPSSYFAPTTRTGYRTRNLTSLARSVRSRAGNASEPFESRRHIWYRLRALNFSCVALVEVRVSMSASGRLQTSDWVSLRPQM